ncbi:deoxyribonuclease IV [Carbonactinospora thermoautotrophica]|nr:deoxyribonuclease IV [Carbonactinospora thermoautotrophica]
MPVANPERPHVGTPPIGAHVPVAGGLARSGLAYARDLGAEAVQVFVTNPRGWTLTPGDPHQDEAFRAACADSCMPVFVHAPYLINFGSPTPATLERSIASLRHTLRRGAEIGAAGVVVHTGSAVAGARREVAMRQVREAILPLLEELRDDGPHLLLEPTAGQGQSLCATVEDLGPYLAALDHHPRVGVCLDTCHAFAAGHDLAAPGGAAATMDALVRAAGEGRLKLIHANDSKDACGSCRDRHENIGQGHIGEDAFAELLRHPAAAGVPWVVETPGGKERHARDVALLQKLRDA